MATERQYVFFKSLYDEEANRTATLADHAKNNLALATLYSAFILFAAEKLRPDTLPSKLVFIAAVLAMLAAFIGSLWATQIADYEALTDPAEIFEGFRDTPPADEEFFDDRIADYTVAYE